MSDVNEACMNVINSVNPEDYNRALAFAFEVGEMSIPSLTPEDILAIISIIRNGFIDEMDAIQV
jgi:hypothetical protein